jgi:hypothetical protein
MKTILIKIKKIGNRINTFSIYDNIGNVLLSSVSKSDLISGISLSIADNVKVIKIGFGGENCCNKFINYPIGEITKPEIAASKSVPLNTSSIWVHQKNNSLYNSFYGCTHPYILEHPFAYQYNDEILQNVKDYTKVYKYLSENRGVSDNNRKVQVDNAYFNKAVIYNDQQSSGVLNLIFKPINNMKVQLSYPKYNVDSKDILYTKSDNFYQYNTFWNVVKNRELPLFLTSCNSLSYDKEVNQENMDYSSRVFKKEKLRAKEVKIRHILDNRTDINLVSTFVSAPSQISYK